MVARRPPKKPVHRVIGDPSIPDSFGIWVPRFLEWLRVRNYSERTVLNRASYLRFFVEWSAVRSLHRPDEVTKAIIERYQRHLFYLRKKDGKPLSFRAQHARLVAVRAFFKWLMKQNALGANPAADLGLPRMEKRLPPAVLTHREAEQVMMQPDVTSPTGLRDRAMLETFYSTGIRRSELAHLNLYDLDAERGTLAIRQGKGKKDRMVPIGERALAWIDRYLNEVRPSMVVPPDEGALFLTRFGEGFRPAPLTHLVRGYIEAAKTGKTGSCHLLRHSMATSMHDNGADIRYIQEILGHVELSTTEIYTQVSIRKLKEIHSATHPSARLGRKGTGGEGRDLEREALLESLAAEADEEPEDED